MNDPDVATVDNDPNLSIVGHTVKKIPKVQCLRFVFFWRSVILTPGGPPCNMSLQHVRLSDCPELSRIQLLNKAPEVAEVHGSS